MTQIMNITRGSDDVSHANGVGEQLRRPELVGRLVAILAPRDVRLPVSIRIA